MRHLELLWQPDGLEFPITLTKGNGAWLKAVQGNSDIPDTSIQIDTNLVSKSQAGPPRRAERPRWKRDGRKYRHG